MKIDRRTLLGASTSVWSLGGCKRRTDASQSLKAVARARGLRFGSDSDGEISSAPAAYRELFLQQCDLYAANMGWRSVNPTGEGYNFAYDPNVKFALDHRLKLTGAHLFWNRSTPEWAGKLSRNDLLKAVENHAQTMAAHFRGNVYSWNVVNEAIEPSDGQPNGLRRWLLGDRLGYDYIATAFHAARLADPNALLLYNDYGLEAATKDEDARRRALLGLLDTLLAKGVPIDGIGLQSHLQLRLPFDAQVYGDFLKELVSRKMKLVITELDVVDHGAPGFTPLRDRLVAERYRRFLDVALEEAAVKAVVTWGLSDRYTWLTPQYDPKLARSDGLPCRPLPFDEDFFPKPAFFAMLNALQQAPTMQR